MSDPNRVTPTADDLMREIAKNNGADGLGASTSSRRDCFVEACERLADALAEVERLRAFRRDLHWAIDLIDMYDRRMIQLGDDPVLVHSAVHLEKKRAVRALLSDDAAEIVDQAFARIDRKTSAGRAEALDCVHGEVCVDVQEAYDAMKAENERLRSLPTYHEIQNEQVIETLLQRAEAAEADVIKWRGAWEIENSLRMGAEAKLAEAQQREAWWRELYIGEGEAHWRAMEVDRWNELRRLLGLEAAEEK